MSTFISSAIGKLFFFVLFFGIGALAAIVIKILKLTEDGTELLEKFFKYTILYAALPILIFSTVSIDNPFTSIKHIAVAFFGIIIWVVTYYVTRFCSHIKVSSESPSESASQSTSASESASESPSESASMGEPTTKYLPFVVSSFGGGNRGVLLIILLQYFSPKLKQDIPLLINFILMDVGYFLALLLVGQLGMQVVFGQVRHNWKDYFKIIREKSGGAIAIIFAMILGVLVPAAGLSSTQHFLLEHVKYWIGPALALLTAFTTFHYSLSARADTSSNSGAASIFIISRAVSGLVLTIFLFSMNCIISNNCGVLSITTKATLWALFIFILLPPSSLIDDLLQANGADSAQHKAAATLNRNANLIYIIIFITIAIAIGLFQLT